MLMLSSAFGCALRYPIRNVARQKLARYISIRSLILEHLFYKNPVLTFWRNALPIDNWHVVALCCACVQLTWAADFLRGVVVHFIPLRDPTCGAGKCK